MHRKVNPWQNQSAIPTGFILFRLSQGWVLHIGIGCARRNYGVNPRHNPCPHHASRIGSTSLPNQRSDNGLWADTGVKPEVIRVDGGLVANHFIVQFYRIFWRLLIFRSVMKPLRWGCLSWRRLEVVFFQLGRHIQNWKKSKASNP